jgi:anti-sigma regulatory factor (Ser/Thr protein kinase)
MKTLAEFLIPSAPGNERLAVSQVLNAVENLSLSKTNLDRLGTAVAEATMNAMEYGNQYLPDTPVEIQVWASKKELKVRITDQGGGKVIFEYITPDLEAKLAGYQSPRGWGLFLIQNMVDDIRITSDGKHRTLELIMNLKAKQ